MSNVDFWNLVASRMNTSEGLISTWLAPMRLWRDGPSLLSSHLKAHLVPGWRYRHLIYHLHSNEVVSSGEKIKKPYVRSLQYVSNLSLVWVLTCRLMYSSQTKTNTANSHKTSQQPNTKTQFLKCSTVQHFGLIMTRYPLDVEQEASFVLSLVRLCKCLEMKIRFLVRSIMMTRQFLLYKWK